MKSIHVLMVFSVLVFSLLSCSKDPAFDDSVYTITTDTTGFYNNDVSQIIESGSFTVAFFSHMEDDTVIRHNAFVYTDKTDGYSLLYKQNRTLDTAFVHELKDGKPTDKALRFYKENDSLIIEDLVYNYENTSFYVKDRTAIDKLESSVLRELGSEISIADIEKLLNETLEYLGETAVYSYLKEKAKEIADYAEEKANNLAAKLKKAADKIKEAAEKIKDKAVEIKDKVMDEIEKANLEKQKQELEKKPKETDCQGVIGGPAKIDKCGICTGGTTGLSPCDIDPRDGKVYKIVIIGTQIWMAENLNYATGNSWCYGNNAANCTTYGRLYDWGTALTACPAGWHLPSDAEWTVLTNYLGTEFFAGGKMKSTTGWNAPNTGASDSSGFSGLPGGYFSDGIFNELGYEGTWWSSTIVDDAAAKFRSLNYNEGRVSIGYASKPIGYSCRCIKD